MRRQEENWILQCELVQTHTVLQRIGRLLLVCQCQLHFTRHQSSSSGPTSCLFSLFCASAENKVLVRTRRCKTSQSAAAFTCLLRKTMWGSFFIEEGYNFVITSFGTTEEAKRSWSDHLYKPMFLCYMLCNFSLTVWCEISASSNQTHRQRVNTKLQK